MCNAKSSCNQEQPAMIRHSHLQPSPCNGLFVSKALIRPGLQPFRRASEKNIHLSTFCEYNLSRYSFWIVAAPARFQLRCLSTLVIPSYPNRNITFLNYQIGSQCSRVYPWRVAFQEFVAAASPSANHGHRLARHKWFVFQREPEGLVSEWDRKSGKQKWR